MIFKLKNKTEHPQSINFHNGECVIIPAGEEYELNAFGVYEAEMKRLKKFFIIEPISINKIAERVVVQEPEPEVFEEEEVESIHETYYEETDTEEEVS